MVNNHPKFDLARFISAQEGVYERALAELKSGQKRTHWMWYIFPQIAGLGFSSISQQYAIQNLEEARQYINHPVLGKRLLECAEAVLAIKGRSVSEIFGYPDDLKLRSCMTLFACVLDSNPVFVRVLEKYFRGNRDNKTLQIINKE